jgi:hypothetical protein
MSRIVIADIETANQLTEISAEESKSINGGFFFGGGFFASVQVGINWGWGRRGCW